MNTFKWREIAESVGVAAILGSLIFVGLQMRQAQNIAILEVYSDLVSSTQARSELITIHSELIAKANGAEQLSDAETIALDEFVTAMWQSEFFATSRWEFLDRATGGPVAYLSKFLCRNGGLIGVWKDQTGWIRDPKRPKGGMFEFVTEVNRAVQNTCGD